MTTQSPPHPCVIFDLDGTLVDSVPDIHACANRAFAGLGHSFTLAEVRGFVGRGAPHLIAQLARSRGLPHEGEGFGPLLAGFMAEYEGATALTQLYPGVLAALQVLQQGGARLGLCTNKPIAATGPVLRDLGLARLFPVVIGGDSLAVKKPDPAPLRETARLLGGGPVIYVGDSEVDAATAEAAAVPFLLFTEGYRKTPVADLPHTAAFDDFAALPALVTHTLSASAAP